MKRRPASEVKSRWRDIVADANRDGKVLVMNHKRPEVMVVSVEHYQALQQEAAAADPLARLRDEFDREMAFLRRPGAGAHLRDIFDATPRELAAAANRARRKRRR